MPELPSDNDPIAFQSVHGVAGPEPTTAEERAAWLYSLGRLRLDGELPEGHLNYIERVTQDVECLSAALEDAERVDAERVAENKRLWDTLKAFPGWQVALDPANHKAANDWTLRAANALFPNAKIVSVTEASAALEGRDG